MQKLFSPRTANSLVKHFSSTLKIGDGITIVRCITKADIQKFIDISGDANPIHFQSGDKKAIVHGAFLNALVSGVIGTKFPGPGTLVVSQTLNFPNNCFEGELVKVTVTLIENRKIMKVKYECVVEECNKTVLFGDAKLINR